MLQKNFDILTTSFLHNYFDGLTKLFSDLYLAEFLIITSLQVTLKLHFKINIKILMIIELIL